MSRLDFVLADKINWRRNYRRRMCKDWEEYKEKQDLEKYYMNNPYIEEKAPRTWREVGVVENE